MWRNLCLSLYLVCGLSIPTLYGQMEGVLVYFQPVSCPGLEDGEVIIEGQGGQAPYLYSIDGCNTYVAPGIFLDLAPGNYTICMLDALGDTGYFQFTMTEPLPLDVEVLDQQRATCFGAPLGQVTVGGLGGTAPYEFRLPGGDWANDPEFTNLLAGTYRVEVRDSLGCEGSRLIGVEQADPIGIIERQVDRVSCTDSTSGFAEIEALGGNGGFEFQLGEAPFQPQGIFDSLQAGTYTLIVRDDSACVDSFAIEIPRWGSWDIQVDAPPLQCATVSDGYISLEANGGTPPYRYQLNGIGEPQLNPRFQGLSHGVYEVAVQDLEGCDTLFQVQLDRPDTLEFSVSLQNLVCANEPTGRAEVTPAGGVPPYAIYWDRESGQGDFIRENLQAGSYVFRIEDSQGCERFGSFQLTQPEPLTLHVETIDPAGCVDATGRIELIAAGGTPPYQYQLDQAALQSESEFPGLLAGVYEAIALDDLGCEASAMHNLQRGDSVVAGFYSVPDLNEPLVLSDANLRLKNISQGATSYEWDFGDGTRSSEAEPIHSYTAEGTYQLQLIVSDDQGTCRDTLVRTVTVLSADELIYFPNVFSPNGDGINDIFRLVGQGVLRAEMIVFNRIGNRVAEVEVFPSGWAGIGSNGKPLPIGVYAYSVRITLSGGEVITQGGSFSMIR